MRIDDENKVVWCSEWLIERLDRANFTSKNGLGKVKILSESTLSGHVPESCEDKKWKKLIDAVYSGYAFKLEQPQKYYWCKKKEHMVWFEVVQDTYLAQDEDDGELTLGWLEGAGWKCKFTEQQARGLLKDDFDKFEKVECE